MSNANDILGAWATVGGTDWAVAGGSGITALGTYVTLDEDLGQPTSPTVVPPLTSDNLLINTTLQNTTTTAINVNSIKIDGTNARGIGQIGLALTTSSGGVLYTGTASSVTGLAGAGTLSQGGGGEMIFQVNNGSLEVGMVIAGTSGLTKDGTGTLILSGANTFTGNINVNGGTLAIVVGGSTTDTTNLGAAGARTINLNGGTFGLIAGVLDLERLGTKAFVIGEAGGTFDMCKAAMANRVQPMAPSPSMIHPNSPAPEHLPRLEVVASSSTAPMASGAMSISSVAYWRLSAMGRSGSIGVSRRSPLETGHVLTMGRAIFPAGSSFRTEALWVLVAIRPTCCVAMSSFKVTAP